MNIAWQSITIGGHYSAMVNGGVTFTGAVSSRTANELIMDTDDGGCIQLSRSTVLRLFKPVKQPAQSEPPTNGVATMATTAKKRSTKKSAKSTLDVLCTFGGISIGQETARVSVKIERNQIDLLRADECFCGKRLIGKIVLGRQGESNGQGKLIEDTDYEVAGAFDVKRIGVTPSQIATGLTFALASINVEDLTHFAKGSGRMIVEEVQEIPDDAGGDAEWEPGDDE